MNRRAAIAVMVGLIVLTSVGCQTVSPGVTNRVGTITAMMGHEPDAIIGAAEQTMNELDLEVVSSQASKLDGALEARSAREHLIRVRAERTDAANSVVSIRYGHLGDEAKSLLILDSIKRHLGEPAQASADPDAEATAEAADEPAGDETRAEGATASVDTEAAEPGIE